MAALTVGPDFDLAGFRAHAAARLPDYARPLFLRLAGSIAATATFKPGKAHLAREGYDPRQVRDALLFDDRARGAYVPLDDALHAALREGQVRV